MGIRGSVKLALLAEGAGELGSGFPSRPGDILPEQILGAGHALVRRMFASNGGLPEKAIVFLAPLRTPRGREPRGSDLTVSSDLRRLLSWPRVEHAPHASVVLLDDDDDEGIARELSEEIGETLPPSTIIAAVPEFEAWLLVDHDALQRVLGAKFDKPPERFGRDDAKARLQNLCSTHRPETSYSTLAREIAQELDLTLAARLPSFLRAHQAVRAIAQRLR